MDGKEVVIFKSVLSGLWYWRLMRASGKEKARSTDGCDTKEEAIAEAPEGVPVRLEGFVGEEPA